MREALFIKKNKDRWIRIQQGEKGNADEMAAEFTRLVDDLAYAKTFYPAGKVTKYVNSLASKIYLDIYQNKKEKTSRLSRFWKYDLPLTIRKHRWKMRFSLFVFLIFFAVAFFIAARDESVIRAIMGDSYVDMTYRNIEKGNPFGVYEGGHPMVAWYYIMMHNIRLAVWDFVSGLFCGIPSLYMLISNAFMVGVFDQMFYSKGLGLDFFLVVFIHGTLEITAIILSAGAGLVLGLSFLFPGTISRLQAFKQGAREGMKILIGLFPVYTIAAFFEGFITRLYNDVPVLTFIVFFGSVVFVIWYFIIYPGRLEKKLADKLFLEYQ